MKAFCVTSFVSYLIDEARYMIGPVVVRDRFRWEGRTRVDLEPTPAKEGTPLVLAGNLFAMPPVYWAHGRSRGMVVHELLQRPLSALCTCRFGPVSWERAFWVPYYPSLAPSIAARTHLEFASDMTGGCGPEVASLPSEDEVMPPTCYREWILNWPDADKQQEAMTSHGTNFVPRASAIERHGALWFSFGLFVSEELFQFLNPFIIRPHLVVQVWDIRESSATHLHDMDVPSTP